MIVGSGKSPGTLPMPEKGQRVDCEFHADQLDEGYIRMASAIIKSDRVADPNRRLDHLAGERDQPSQLRAIKP